MKAFNLWQVLGLLLIIGGVVWWTWDYIHPKDSPQGSTHVHDVRAGTNPTTIMVTPASQR